MHSQKYYVLIDTLIQPPCTIISSLLNIFNKTGCFGLLCKRIKYVWPMYINLINFIIV